jgi:putative endonuclease
MLRHSVAEDVHVRCPHSIARGMLRRACAQCQSRAPRNDAHSGGAYMSPAEGGRWFDNTHTHDSNRILMPGGYVYILTNTHNTTLYVGVTSQLHTRIQQHRDKIFPKSFTKRYNLTKLVYFEEFSSIESAIAREKQLKAGSRGAKLALISSTNPNYRDLFDSL